MIQVEKAEDHGLSLDVIQIDGGTQSRALLNQHVVDDYAEAIKAGAAFPLIVVFYDGKKHWLADGFHRFHAYQKAGRTNVPADVRQGTRRDAILHSVGANEAHGLRRTNDDKRRAVLTLLNDGTWSKWTDREIAAACRVDHKTVGKVRSEVTGDFPSERTYTTKHGTVATMKTAGINASRKNAQEGTQLNDEPSPEAGPQAEASLVGTDTGTPADREGRREGEAASADLPTSPRNIFNELVALWKEAEPGVRQDFKAYIKGSEFVAKINHSVPASSQATEQTGAVPVIPAAPVAPITPAHVPGHSLDREPVANEPAPGALAGACNFTRSNTIGRTPPAPISKEPKLNPDCLKAARGEACFLSHSAASCSKCASAATKARKAA